jgi:hypothetical protein
MTDLRIDPATVPGWLEAARALGPDDRRHGPPAGDERAGGTAGAPLARLLGLVRLTPAQAMEIGAGVLAVAEHATRLRLDQVLIRTDGTVGLVPAPGQRPVADSADVPTDVRTDDSAATAAAAVLTELVDTTRRGNRRLDPTAAGLLEQLDRARSQLPSAGLPSAAQTLSDARATIDTCAVRSELAALVEVILGSREPAGTGAPVGGMPRTGTARRGRPAGRRPGRGGSRTALRRIGAWLISVAVLAAIVSLEVAVLRDEIATDVGLLLDAGRSGAAAPGEPEPDGLPVTPPAPATAGPVAAVDLRPLAPCTPDAPCPVRVLVRVRPGPDPQAVSWSFRVLARCPGAPDAAEPVPGGAVTVPPGVEAATAVGSVAVPPGPGVAVFAVTDQPAAAASPPVLVGTCRVG